jgi:RHS repeat-associated protein
LQTRGAEIATYTYDAWGNITGRTYVEGNEIPYELNHITYRGYYRDEETGFYYLQSRYYDAEVGRFINADDVDEISVDVGLIYKDNLYIYCNGNPVNNYDDDGTKSINITSKLSGLMIKNAMKLYTMAKLSGFLGIVGKVALLNKFYNLVKTGGEWDLKNKNEWKLNKGDSFTYIKLKYSSADIGNIHFGFVGSVLFSWKTLCTGAGIYQIYSGTSKWSYWYSFFDDPRDTYCISVGRALWKVLFLGKKVYQW